MPKPTKATSAKKPSAKKTAPASLPPISIHQVPHDSKVEILRSLILRHLTSTLARYPEGATQRDWWVATALAVRDTIHERMIATQSTHAKHNVRRLYYFSMEYLMGRLFECNLHATGMIETAKEALAGLGVDYAQVREAELDMGLGNGGLGRLAACFLDSLSTQDYPALGYGIYYEFGLFKQEFVNGHQVEHPDRWRVFGSPWEVMHSEYAQEIPLYGRVENVFDDRGNYTPRWVDTKSILGIPHDIPIAGYGTKTVNLLRLWSSHATEDFDLAAFNSGGYAEAVREKEEGETISKVLYPNDKTENGKELRLVQQYFFVACSLRDLIRRHFRDQSNSWDNFADKVAIQLNDTHPAIAVPELLRIMIDDHELGWDLGDHHAQLRIYESHPVARGVGEVGRAALPAGFAAPPADHFRDQQPPDEGLRSAVAGRQREEAHLFAHRGERFENGAHGQSRGGRLARGQRRGGAAHAAAEKGSVPRIRRALPGQISKQDQRHHAAPLAAAVQSAAVGLHHQDAGT
jgi:starch phosphorylase